MQTALKLKMHLIWSHRVRWFRRFMAVYEISKLGQLMDEIFHGRTFGKLLSDTDHSLQFFVMEFQSYKFSD